MNKKYSQLFSEKNVLYNNIITDSELYLETGDTLEYPNEIVLNNIFNYSKSLSIIELSNIGQVDLILN